MGTIIKIVIAVETANELILGRDRGTKMINVFRIVEPS